MFTLWTSSFPLCSVSILPFQNHDILHKNNDIKIFYHSLLFCLFLHTVQFTLCFAFFSLGSENSVYVFPPLFLFLSPFLHILYVHSIWEKWKMSMLVWIEGRKMATAWIDKENKNQRLATLDFIRKISFSFRLIFLSTLRSLEKKKEEMKISLNFSFWHSIIWFEYEFLIKYEYWSIFINN